MTTNVGMIDRALRAALGAVLLYLAFASGVPLFAEGVWKYLAAAAGVVMLLVALVRICPIYALFGVKTCEDC